MNSIFDTHTHILPCMDDGSGSSNESIDMLRSLYKMGVRDVALTPHFYARRDEPDRFLYNRDSTAEHLMKRIREYTAENKNEMCIPRLYLGAEVAFFNAMSNVEEMKQMCISGTDILLVEMPFDRWTEAMTDELRELKRKQGVTPLLAHIDRYYGCFTEQMLDTLLDHGVKIQINADGFTRFFSRKRSLELLKDKKIHYIGSDSHNMGVRAPNIDSAIAEIEKRVGVYGLFEIYENSYKLASIAKAIYSPNEAEDGK